MKKARPYPRVVVTKKAARSLRAGHPWVFEGEILRVEPSQEGTMPEPGGLVDVFEENGTWQGAGLISPQSKIRVRILSKNANDRFDLAFWERRLQWAWQHRLTTMGSLSLPGCEPDTNCCRVVFSEADSLPGLIVDRYEDVLVAQVGTVGMERLCPLLYPLLVQVLAGDGVQVRGIYERNDSPSRVKEGLELYKGWYDFSSAAQSPWTDALAAAGTALPQLPLPDDARVMAQENGIVFDLDLENSQKTGFFLDQKYNRRAVRNLAAGKRVLDCFCHVGPFGLNAAAGGADFVRFVDVSQTAIDLARENARLNGFLPDGVSSTDKIGFTCANVLEYLPELARDKGRLRQEGGPFDLIVLDPPAFTKSRSTISHAQKGYREINQAAMRLLPRGGSLATCSCSHFMSRDLLANAIAEAAHNVNVQLKQVAERQQAPDHPILWGVPETHYLDFFIFQVV